MNNEDIKCIAIEIYNAQIKYKPYHFLTLVKAFDGKIDKIMVSLCLNTLLDFFMIEEKYEPIDENRSAKVIRITEDAIPIVKGWIKEAKI